MFGVGPIELVVLLLFFIVPLGLLIWALIDAIQNPRLSDNERLIWIIVIIFVGCVGPVLYLVMGRSK